MSADINYIALQSGGFFYDACLTKGFLKKNESCVIEYKQFIKFMNNNEVSMPIFVGDTYEICIKVAKELNSSADAIRFMV